MVERAHGDDPLGRVREHMSVLASFAATNVEPLSGAAVAISSHLEPSTGVFVETIRDAGATVYCTASNADSIHGDVVDRLDAQPDISVFASEGMSEDALDSAQRELLEHDLDVLCTDGAELLARLYDDPELSPAGIDGVAEQTTSGVTRARAMETDGLLDTPVFAVNHTPMKHWFDNVHGTGESALSNVMLATNTRLAGRTVVVAGYGYVGRGIATKARELGAQTVVTEVDPRNAIRAHVDGHRVLPMVEAAELGELFFTATGNCHVITDEHFDRLQDGAILCNAGHSDVEVDVDGLAARADVVTDIGEGLTRYRLADGRAVEVFADGTLANLAGPYSQGHPAEIMDATFAALFVATRELARQGDDYPAGVHQLPAHLDREVAEKKCDALGIEIDSLTDRQRRYLDDWRHEDIA